MQWGLDRPQIERVRAVAEPLEQIDAQRIERQIEGDIEIRREMGAGDLQSVRLEIVDQQLAEAAFLSDGLPGGRGGAGDFVVSAGLEPERLVVVAILGADRRAFDEPFMETKFAVIADRDDNAGDGAVFLAVDREILDALVEFVMALLELGGFGHQRVGPLVLRGFLELRETLFDALDFPGDFGWQLGRLRTDAAVLRGEVVCGIEHRPGPGPGGAQFGGLLFELLERQPADEGGIVHKAILVAAEEIAGDRAAGGLVRRDADEDAQIGVGRDGALREQALHRVGRDVGLVLELMPHGELRRVVGAEREGHHHFEADVAFPIGVEQLGGELAQAQALPDVPLRHAEAGGDGLDGLAGINQGRHGDEFVRRVHGGADRVLHQRRLEGLALGLDQARHLEVVGDDALGGKLLQGLEPPPAGGDGVDALLAGRGVDDQVLL